MTEVVLGMALVMAVMFGSLIKEFAKPMGCAGARRDPTSKP